MAPCIACVRASLVFGVRPLLNPQWHSYLALLFVSDVCLVLSSVVGCGVTQTSGFGRTTYKDTTGTAFAIALAVNYAYVFLPLLLLGST